MNFEYYEINNYINIEYHKREEFKPRKKSFLRKLYSQFQNKELDEEYEFD